MNKESVTHCSQFISVKVQKILRKSQAQFWENLRKLRLRKTVGFHIKKQHVVREYDFFVYLIAR